MIRAYYNPNGADVVYYRLQRGEKESIYFRVDFINQYVSAVCDQCEGSRGQRFQFGVYRIKFTTFMQNYAHYCTYWGNGGKVKARKLFGRDVGTLAHKMKLTTHTQYTEAWRRVITEIKIPVDLRALPKSEAPKTREQKQAECPHPFKALRTGFSSNKERLMCTDCGLFIAEKST